MYAIKNIKLGIFSTIQFDFNAGNINSFDDMRNNIDEYHIDESDILSIPTDDRIDIVECYGDESGLEFSADTDGIRRQLEISTTIVIANLARESAYEALQSFEKFMEEHDLEFENIVADNNYGSFRHYAERGEGEHCQVYLYRNLEGEGIHINVWEYKQDGLELYFETRPNEVSPTEEYFDAS